MGKNRSGSRWLGGALFLLIVFGPRLLPQLSNLITQTTGLNIAPGVLLAGLIGLYIVVSVVVPAIRTMARPGNGDTRLPTSLAPPPVAAPPPMSTPRSTTSPRPPGPPRQSPMRLPDSSSPPTQPPGFDPIIDPRVLTIGIIGLLVFGSFLLGALFLSGSLP